MLIYVEIYIHRFLPDRQLQMLKDVGERHPT